MDSPILSVARKELLERLASRRYVALVCLSALVLILAFVGATGDYQTRLENYETALAQGGEAFAVVEPSPLGILARGVGDELGRRFDVDPQVGLIRAGARPGSASTLFTILPPIDVLYVVRVIMSLVAALLLFDAVSGERERGRLSLLLSYPVSRAAVFAGKWLGGVVALGAAVLPAALVGLLYVIAIGRVRLDGAAWWSVLMFFAVAAAYLSFFLTVGLLISCRTRRAATSSVVTLLVWSFLVFILPSLSARVAGWREPLPLAQRLEVQNTRAWIGGVLERIEARRASRPTDEPLGRAVLREVGGPDRDYFARLARRQAFAAQLAAVSPASALVDAATGIADTGAGAQLRFMSNLLAYRAHVVEDGEGGSPEPLIVPSTMGAASAWQHLRLPLVSLLLGSALAFMLGLWSLNRYDAR